MTTPLRPVDRAGLAARLDVQRTRYFRLLMGLAQESAGDDRAATLDRIERILRVEQSWRREGYKPTSPADMPIRFSPDTGPQPGYVVGHCGHRVAESEWAAGYRVCERCPITGPWPGWSPDAPDDTPADE